VENGDLAGAVATASPPQLPSLKKKRPFPLQKKMKRSPLLSTKANKKKTFKKTSVKLLRTGW